MKRRGYALSILLLFLDLHISVSSGNQNGVCISKGGRFPPFSSEGKPPKKASRGSQDMTLCRVFRRKTCCDVAQTYPALLSVRRLALAGEANQECLHLWELLECSICDPGVGVQPGPPLLCSSFCDRVYQACSNAYFSMDAKTRALVPCGANEFVCGKASEWVSNGTEFCGSAGFAVYNDAYFGTEEASSCYGGKASLDAVAESWKGSRTEFPLKDGKLEGDLEDFLQWVQERPFSEKVSWAVGGMVLTAGLLFLSKRKSYSQRQKLAAIQRTARKMEGKFNQRYPPDNNQAIRKRK